MTDTGRTIFGSGGGGANVAGFTGSSAYIWSDGGTVDLDGTSTFNFGHFTGGTGISADLATSSDWADWDSGTNTLSVTEPGIYVATAQVTFGGTGSAWQQWAQIYGGIGTTRGTAKPIGLRSVDLLTFAPCDPNPSRSIDLAFGSADGASTVTYAELVVYKVL